MADYPDAAMVRENRIELIKKIEELRGSFYSFIFIRTNQIRPRELTFRRSHRHMDFQLPVWSFM